MPNVNPNGRHFDSKPAVFWANAPQGNNFPGLENIPKQGFRTLRPVGFTNFTIFTSRNRIVHVSMSFQQDV